MKELPVTEQEKEKMVELAYQTMQNAYAPYSQYKVGAAVMAEDGTLFSGCNVENASYGITICAETTAICSMVAAGKKHIRAIAVIASGNQFATPCGRCRQFIREFSTPTTDIYLCDNTKTICKTTTIDELLPFSFGPEYINTKKA